MSTAPAPAHPWPQFVCPRDGTYSLADSGFLLDPLHSSSERIQPAVVPLARLADYGCAVLLGEPGSGKSVALRELSGGGGSPPGRVLAHNLASYSSDALLVSRVFESPEIIAWRNDESETVTLVLDSFDECLLRVEAFAALLADELGRLPCARLRLRIACRTVVWPTALEDRLRDVFGADRLGVFELLPLRRADVRTAAAAAAVDPDAFLDEVFRREAVPLAIRPITLRFLLTAFADPRGLPGSQVELYERGCEHLCREASRTRIDSRRTGAFTVGQRLAVAGRIAAVTLVCRRPVIDATPGGGAAEDDRLSLRDLIGGRETGDRNAFDVTEAAVLEALDTGLFSSRGPGLVGFAHQTYAEFLAAFYLAGRVTHDQLVRLLTHPTDAGNRVVPQLHEVAAWSATLDPALFPTLVAADPLVLLGSDLPGMDTAFRARLVDGLLDLARSGRLVNHGFGTRYRRLAHPGLSAQLGPTVRDRAAPPAARREAIDIAEACDSRELLDDLVRLALDPTEEYHTRVQAGYAVARIGEPATWERLRPCVLGAVGDDPDDSLKGVALRALFPARLSAADVFAALTRPKQENYYGAYAAFYSRHLPDHLCPAHLPAALAWLATQPATFSHYLPFRGLVERIMTLAWDHLDDPAALAAYVPVVVARVLEYVPIPGLSDSGEGPNPDRRWQLFEAVLPVFRAAGHPHHLLLRTESPLVTAADGAALIARTVRETDPETQEYLARLVASAHGNDAAATGRIVEAARVCPALARVFAPQLTPVRLDSDEARERRAEHARWEATEREFRERREALRRPVPNPAPSAVVARLLGEAEAGEGSAWWRLNNALRFQPDGLAADELDPDLTQLPGWQAAPADTRARIVAAGARYLTDAGTHTAEWLGSNQVHRPDWAGLRALWVLAREAPAALDALPAETWARWAPVVVGYPCRFNEGRIERHRALARRAYSSAPDAVTSAVDQVIERGRVRGWVSAHELLRGWLDGRLAAVLLRHVREERVRPEDRRSMLDILLAANDPGTVAYLVSLVPDPPPPARHSRRRPRAVEAACLLCRHSPGAGWPAVWAAARRDPAFGRDVIGAVADRWDWAQRTGTVLGRCLSEEQVADLFAWLTREFPPAAAPGPGAVITMTGGDTLGRFRDTLLDGLRDRGTPEAVAAIERLVRELPDHTWLRWTAESARQTALRTGWLPPAPAHLLRLVEDRSRRLVESGEQLLAVLRESLVRLEAELRGETPAAPDLWNVVRGAATSTPKEEVYLSDYIHRHLRRDLVERGVVVNREVEIRRGEGAAQGERTDIQVSAVGPDGNGRVGTVQVVIEVKGCWNRARETDLSGQLRERYLRENRCCHGLYVVGWFTCDQWDTSDRTRRRAPKQTAGEVRPRFDDLARAASGDGVLIEAFILDARLR